MASVIEARYQTFWPRFWAGWIDAAIWLPLLFLDFWLEEHVQSPVFLALWLIAYTLSFDIYSVAMLAKFGQTLGKMAMGVRVLDISERKLSLRQAVLRDCVPIGLSLLIIFDDLPRVLAGVNRVNDGELGLVMQVGMYGTLLWFAAEFLTMFMSSKRRALHDFIAGTVVVRTRLASVAAEHDATAG
jgi:uncharacterized RDD family membrane protein YckC